MTTSTPKAYCAVLKSEPKSGTIGVRLQSRIVRFRYFYESPIAKSKMCDFSAQTVDAWLDWMLKHPTAQNPGRKSFDHELRVLGIVLHWYRNMLNPSFIVPIVRRHRQRCKYKVVPPRRPDYFLRPEEIRRWIAWLRQHRKNPVYYRLATFLVLTGCRLGEAVGMCWEEVDLDRRVARVVRTVWWDHKTRQPQFQQAAKTEESIRVLTLPRELVEVLRETRGHRKRAVTERYAKVVALLDHKTGDDTARHIGLRLTQMGTNESRMDSRIAVVESKNESERTGT